MISKLDRLLKIHSYTLKNAYIVFKPSHIGLAPIDSQGVPFDLQFTAKLAYDTEIIINNKLYYRITLESLNHNTAKVQEFLRFLFILQEAIAIRTELALTFTVSEYLKDIEINVPKVFILYDKACQILVSFSDLRDFIDSQSFKLKLNPTFDELTKI